VQEAIGYDAAVYAGLDQHLQGAPPGDYLKGTGAVIARASRLVEPALAPLLRSLVAQRHPRRVLDVGCGTGVYLIHAAAAGGPQLTGHGVDLDATVVDLARQRLVDAGLASRFQLHHADIRTIQVPAASFDLVLLFQNIYYFAEDQRHDLLHRLHGLLAPDGALVLASLLAGRSLAAAHYDLLFRATEGCGPLPRRQELDRQLRNAGFTTTSWIRHARAQRRHSGKADDRPRVKSEARAPGCWPLTGRAARIASLRHRAKLGGQAGRAAGWCGGPAARRGAQVASRGRERARSRRQAAAVASSTVRPITARTGKSGKVRLGPAWCALADCCPAVGLQ
jgi:SAM-dependent methyltransferase